MSAFELPICIAYRPPRLLLWFVSGVHAGALCCIWLAALPGSVRFTLGVVVLASAWYELRSLVRERVGAATGLLLDREDTWSVCAGDMSWHSARLLPGAFVHPRCQVLRLHTPEGRRTFVLTGENVPLETLRRLRVRLRHPING